MKAEKHYQKGAKLRLSQQKMDDADADNEAIVEICYIAAHHFLLAGLEWRGIAHPQSHKHSENLRLLKQLISADSDPDASKIDDEWRALDALRPGHVYGSASDPAGVAGAREALETIRQWATNIRSQQTPQVLP